MKLQKNQSGYNHLLNDQGQPIYCIRRTPPTTIMPDKLGQPLAIVLPTETSFCGDHCPFFRFEASQIPTMGLDANGDGKIQTGIVELCMNHTRGVSEVLEQPTKTDHKILKLQ